MKSFCTIALFLLAALAWTSGAAHAQSGPYTSTLFPWFRAAPDTSGVQPAAYNSEPLGGSNDALSGNVPDNAACPCELSQNLNAPCSGGCDMCGAADRKWFATASALAMTRNRATATWLTTASNDSFDVLLNTENARAGWAGGWQFSLGYAWRGLNGPKVAVTYWQLTPMNGSASISDNTGNPATALSSTISFAPGALINGVPATQYFDNAQEQAIWRKDRVYNIELNLQSGNHSIGSFQIAGLAGIRYFRFTENLIYGSASFGNSFSSNGGANAAYINQNCTNNLLGGQIGAVISSLLTNNLTVFAIPKVGIYGNQMNNLQLIYAGSAVNTPDSVLAVQKSDVSVLSELDMGLNWAFNSNWRLMGAYRVVSVTNLSLADNQFATYGHVEQSGSLILHGAYLGLGCAF